MPMFYFNVRRGAVVYEDHDGVELAGMDEALRHASRDALLMMQDEPEVPASIQWIEVMDERGNAVLSLSFPTVQSAD